MKTRLYILLLALLALPAGAASLVWDLNDSTENVVKYIVYKKSGTLYLKQGEVAAPNHSYTITVTASDIWAVTAVSDLGLESMKAELPVLAPKAPANALFKP